MLVYNFMSHLLLRDSKSTNTTKMKQIFRYDQFTDLKSLKQKTLKERRCH